MIAKLLVTIGIFASVYAAPTPKPDPYLVNVPSALDALPYGSPYGYPGYGLPGYVAPNYGPPYGGVPWGSTYGVPLAYPGYF
ncbi:hypothetical protein K7432_008835 [Basidiobolus ranarum]|uniref:Uncharacterized protein n=1 Tax=Basidiobolus ranarum TaxID=34480 RepID=A0ABR2WR74_9FUNG